MTAENAKLAAEAWLETATLPADLKGRKMQLIVFENDEDCRFFYPRRVLQFQQQITTYLSRRLRMRGAKIVRFTLTPADYWQWLHSTQDDHLDISVRQEMRREFAESYLRLID